MRGRSAKGVWRRGAWIVRELTLHLDDFGREALEHFARGGRDPHSAAVRTASLYYLADREGGRPAWRVPRCAESRRGAADVTVRLDEETWRALLAEAERQDVSAADLTRHAVLYVLADVDSGRAGHRLERTLRNSDGEP